MSRKMASSYSVGQAITTSLASQIRSTCSNSRVKLVRGVQSCGVVAPQKGNNNAIITMAVNDIRTTRSENCKGKEQGLVFPAEESYVQDAAEALKVSEVIAVPTDTLYGFACDACSEAAVSRVYSIKGRNVTRPLAICVGDVEDIRNYGTVEHLPKGLLGALFPGPVTLILPRGEKSMLHRSLNPGLPSIGVRIPDSGFIRSLCRAFGGALALTSANSSSQESTVAVEEFLHLWSHCHSVYNAGTLPAGRAGSTIVDLTVPGNFRILRSGSALLETVQILSEFKLLERTE